jgi:arginine-tRNA-protein transferase
LVHDAFSVCPYLHDRVARMPMRLPCRRLRPTELDERLQAGDRRQGIVLYRTACPACHACQPIRLDLERFTPSHGHRRVLRASDRRLTVSVGPPMVDDRRVELYNLHKVGRGLCDGQPAIDREGYEDFLVRSCCESLELRYTLGHELVGVAITDRGRHALSAVYCFYDPRHARFSLGTYSILKQVELARGLGLRHLYLGLYIADSAHMAYKGRYLPHERMIEGRWVHFARDH